MQGRRGGILKKEEKTINKQEIKCPRCESTNTKFCYYNNYNLNQPRHYCKSCRRYWTKGGALRNVPVGGATRKINSKHPHSILTSSNSSSNYYPSSSKPQVPSVHDQQQYPITSDVTAGFFNISQYQYSCIDLGTHENFFGMQ